MSKEKLSTQLINAALLARVSGESQRDNSSHESQLGRCRSYCANNNYQIVTERKEVFSGAFVLARSDFNDLLEMGAAGQIDVIVVDIPDRLGRGDVIAKCELLAQLNNCRIEYASPGFDQNTVEGVAGHAVHQLVSGIERIRIGQRTSRGKVDFAKAGRVIAPPRRPYGYTVVNTYDDKGKKTDCTFEIVAEEAQVISLIFKLCNDGLTTKQIAAHLSEAGIPRISTYDDAHSATRKAIAKRRHQWEHWPRATIASILGNTLYKGEWQYGRRKVTKTDSIGGIKTTTTRRDPSEIISVPVPAIVTADIWEMAQVRLERNASTKFARPTKRVYLLRKRLRCALCGGLYYCISTGRGPRYYNCGRHNYDPLAEHCPAGSVSADRLETIVWHVVCEEMQHPERLLTGAHKRQEKFYRDRHLTEQAIAALAELDEKDKQRGERILDLYSAGHLTLEKYLAKQAEVDASLAKRAEEREKLLERMVEISVLDPKFEETLMVFQEEIGRRLHPNVSMERKLALLDLLALECIYNSTESKMQISGLFGDRIVSTTPM